MDLARAILLELEKCPFTGERHDIVIEGCAPEDISYHILLLYEAGFIDAERMTRYKGYHEWKAKTITWHGHEFLESMGESQGCHQTEGGSDDAGCSEDRFDGIGPPHVGGCLIFPSTQI
jgi:DNA-binding transcriptional ArsR family regulator